MNFYCIRTQKISYWTEFRVICLNNLIWPITFTKGNQFYQNAYMQVRSCYCCLVKKKIFLVVTYNYRCVPVNWFHSPPPGPGNSGDFTFWLSKPLLKSRQYGDKFKGKSPTLWKVNTHLFYPALWVTIKWST